MRTLDHPELGPPAELAHGDFEIVVRRLADDLAFGTDASLFTGSGIEYAQSRPYQPGDPIRQMDWRLTARTGRPYIKEYEALKRTEVVLVVDTSESMRVASTAVSKFDLAIWIGAAIGLIAQRRLSPTTFVGAGETETRAEPSLATSDLWRAIEPFRASAATWNTGRAPIELTAVGAAVRRLRARLRRSSVIVVLSDLHDDDAVAALREAAQRHDVVAIELHDPAESEPLRAGFLRARESESGRAFLSSGRTRFVAADPDRRDEREVARTIARSGASHLRLRTDRPFVPALRQFLATRAAAGGGRG